MQVMYILYNTIVERGGNMRIIMCVNENILHRFMVDRHPMIAAILLKSTLEVNYVTYTPQHSSSHK